MVGINPCNIVMGIVIIEASTTRGRLNVASAQHEHAFRWHNGLDTIRMQAFLDKFYDPGLWNFCLI